MAICSWVVKHTNGIKNAGRQKWCKRNTVGAELTPTQPDATERLGPDFFKFVLTQHTHAHFKYVESTFIPHVPGRHGEK